MLFILLQELVLLISRLKSPKIIISDISVSLARSIEFLCVLRLCCQNLVADKMYQQEAVYYAVEFLTRHILKQQFLSHAAFCMIFHFYLNCNTTMPVFCTVFPKGAQNPFIFISEDIMLGVNQVSVMEMTSKFDNSDSRRSIFRAAL